MSIRNAVAIVGTVAVLCLPGAAEAKTGHPGGPGAVLIEPYVYGGQGTFPTWFIQNGHHVLNVITDVNGVDAGAMFENVAGLGFKNLSFILGSPCQNGPCCSTLGPNVTIELQGGGVVCASCLNAYQHNNGNGVTFTFGQAQLPIPPGRLISRVFIWFQPDTVAATSHTISNFVLNSQGVSLDLNNQSSAFQENCSD